MSTSRLINLHGYATAEITDFARVSPRLVITNERVETISLSMESARLLYAALRTFESEGLLS